MHAGNDQYSGRAALTAHPVLALKCYKGALAPLRYQASKLSCQSNVVFASLAENVRVNAHACMMVTQAPESHAQQQQWALSACCTTGTLASCKTTQGRIVVWPLPTCKGRGSCLFCGANLCWLTALAVVLRLDVLRS